jgi:hypothetical protein
MIQFGIGAISVNPVGGNEATNPTPYTLLTIQDVSLDIDQKLVELQGQRKMPDDVAPSDITIKGKFSVGRISFGMWNNIMFGETNFAVGGIFPVPDEEHSIPASTPFTVTVTNSVKFQEDRGVQYLGTPPAGNAQDLTRVTGTPTTGQYAVSAGVYTFAAADEGLSVLISYTQTLTTGNNFTVTNQLQGYGPVFSLLLPLQYYLAEDSAATIPSSIYLPKCRASKLGAEMKRNDYLKPSFEFEAYPDASGYAIRYSNAGAA